jgi:hypothetical protein
MSERKAIYQSQRDREKFLCYLESVSRRYAAVIHTYYTIKSKAPKWLERDFILSYFGKKQTAAKKRLPGVWRSIWHGRIWCKSGEPTDRPKGKYV